MATLTTSYQLLAQTYLGSSYGDLYIRLYAKYSEQSVANNRSRVQFQGRAYFTGSYIRDNQGSGSVSGSSGTASGACTYPTKGETIIATTDAWINHAADGSLGVVGSASLSFPNWGWSGTASGSATVPTIARMATITSAPNFTNLDNPTITYSNPAGFKVNTWLEINPTNTHLCIRENIGNGGNYTYELTDEEREALIECCTKTTATIRFGMYTYNGTTLIGTHYVDKTFTLTEDIVPTANVTISDTEGHFDKYGKFVQGQSKLYVVIAAEGVYGSTIKSYKTMFDGKTFTDAEFTTDAIIGKDELNLEIVVTDSRDRTCTVKESIAVYEYKPPKIMSINAKRCQKHNVNELGDEYLGVVFNSEVTSLDSQNSVKYELDYKKATEDSYTTVALDDYTNMHEVAGYTIFAADDDAYNIILRITDDFGTVEKKTNGPSISVLISKLKYNLGLAFGKLAELTGVLDIGFKTRFHGGILHMILEDGTIADEVLIPNKYLLKADYTYEGFPESEVNAILDVIGNEEFVLQRFCVVSKTNPRIYERVYDIEGFGDWICTFRI